MIKRFLFFDIRRTKDDKNEFIGRSYAENLLLIKEIADFIHHATIKSANLFSYAFICILLQNVIIVSNLYQNTRS